MVVTNDVHYIREEDAVPHDLLLCIQTGKKVSDQDRMRYEGGQYYLKSEEEMQKVFPMRERRWIIPIKLPSDVMWRLFLVSRKCQSLMCRKVTMHFLT